MPVRKRKMDFQVQPRESMSPYTPDIIEEVSEFPEPASSIPPARLPERLHQQEYHYPLLLKDRKACDALLEWFDDVEKDRNMPWRKDWIDPEQFEGTQEELDKALAVRAYQVWVSEIMLQQTRVSTVIPYFEKWIKKWPTVQDLAIAKHDDVLSVWKGLGYYSRATRLQEAAKKMVLEKSESCPLPRSAADLQKFPGIGRYTAGAISSIAFGEAEPVLDGNVIRVLSRQLAYYAEADSSNTKDLWYQADILVKHVSEFSETQPSAIPGRWNQAIMELGSTICTPQPKCHECPIQSTCRAYREGENEFVKKSTSPPAVPDIEEDPCRSCEPMDPEELAKVVSQNDNEAEKKTKTQKRAKTKQSNTISNYFTRNTPVSESGKEKDEDEELSDDSSTEQSRKRKRGTTREPNKIISNYCSLFPKKKIKKAPAQVKCVSCIVEVQFSEEDSKWLIEQRPAKGLLASLWQFPQKELPDTEEEAKDREALDREKAEREAFAREYMLSLDLGDVDLSDAECVRAPLPFGHTFSHIQLTTYAHHFKISMDESQKINFTHNGPPARKWVDTADVDKETLSTGVRNIWTSILAGKRAAPRGSGKATRK